MFHICPNSIFIMHNCHPAHISLTHSWPIVCIQGANTYMWGNKKGRLPHQVFSKIPHNIEIPTLKRLRVKQ